jgi:hypothetical protein
MKPRGLEPSQFSLAVGDTGCCRPCLRPEVVLDAVDMRREAPTQHSEVRVNEVFTGRDRKWRRSKPRRCCQVESDGGPAPARLPRRTADEEPGASELSSEAVAARGFGP